MRAKSGTARARTVARPAATASACEAACSQKKFASNGAQNESLRVIESVAIGIWRLRGDYDTGARRAAAAQFVQLSQRNER